MERETIIHDWTIVCNNKCEECRFNWRNAQHNPDCFLNEMLDFIDKHNDNIMVY